MNTVLLLALLGQCDYRPFCEVTPQVWYSNPWSCNRPTYWWYMYAPNTWNQAVDELRRARAERPRPQLSFETQSLLQDLSSQKDQLWLQLIEAPKEEKADIRQEYYKIKKRLEIARIAAARQLR